ncbi:MAG: 1-deoxy-D-xylulose-5-phosphate synthase [Candidatus Nanopelagicales bacterium]|nr:1-deoxy-D-xylulose-5-phosphate synthase [Candidatus Nanopelagicales bacterium]
MDLLGRIRCPEDLRFVNEVDLPELAAEIRAFLIENVARTGGHLGSNLGVVELTLALHRAYDSPSDAILWDTGHQTYVHKIITGRRDRFHELRQVGGLSGYPSREESPHDWIENSHASTALSYADGLAKAWDLSGELAERHIAVVVGDGSLTGGMAWEALNNIAASDRPMVIVVNDNARSYNPTIGGVASYLATLRTTQGYERFLEWGRRTLSGTPVIGAPVYGTLHGVKRGLKDIVAPQGLFEDLGLKYLGPFDGHDVRTVEGALRRARDFGGPVIVHCLTEKGRGYGPAELDEDDKFHGVGVINPETGVPVCAPSPTWTSVFAREMVKAGQRRPDVVAITAAMQGPTGLAPFAKRFPGRCFDVGIAEQHAVTSAAGMAMGGLHPVVAVYSTFLNRAYDQVLLDAGLHRAAVTFVLDRAGITGDDGPSHNGMWDLSMLAGIPGMRVAAPRDGDTLAAEFAEALAISDGPTALRFPKGALPNDIPELRREVGIDVLFEDGFDVLLVSVGPFADLAIEVADLLRLSGVGVTVVDPRWVLPVSEALVDMSRGSRLVVTIEDNSVRGGVGASVQQAVSHVPVVTLGIPCRFIEQGPRSGILAELGFTPSAVAETIAKRLNETETFREGPVEH